MSCIRIGNSESDLHWGAIGSSFQWAQLWSNGTYIRGRQQIFQKVTFSTSWEKLSTHSLKLPFLLHNYFHNSRAQVNIYFSRRVQRNDIFIHCRDNDRKLARGAPCLPWTKPRQKRQAKAFFVNCRDGIFWIRASFPEERTFTGKCYTLQCHSSQPTEVKKIRR